MDSSTNASHIIGTQAAPQKYGHYQVLQKAFDYAAELLGGMTTWLAIHDATGYHTIIRLDPAFGIDSDMHTALEIMAVTWPQNQVHLKPWQGYMLLFTSFEAQQEARGALYSLGMLFTGRFELTERRAGVIEGLRCIVQAIFNYSPPYMCLDFPTKEAGPTVVCSCCRRLLSPQHGWIHWDDLRLIETGHASSHTMCDHCAANLYEEVLNGKN